MNYNLIFISVFLNLLILFFYKPIINFFNIYDHKDSKRKFQKISVPIIGGLIVLLNIFVIFIYSYFLKINFVDNTFFVNNRDTFSFFFGLLLFYLFGLYDDKFNLNPNIKLLISTILVIFFISIDHNLLINNLKFSFLSNRIELNNFSYFFTILSFLLFFNALNMFDGINLQVGAYAILIFLIFVTKGVFINISIIIIISLLVFLNFNFKNKAYLGDGGVYLLSYVISYIFIKSYNKNLFIADEIFFIMFLPGLDMFRVFLIRLYKGQNPFKPDRNHFHHLLLNYYSSGSVFIIIFTSIFLIILLYYFINPIFLFISIVTLYLGSLFFLKNIINFNNEKIN